MKCGASQKSDENILKNDTFVESTQEDIESNIKEVKAFLDDDLNVRKVEYAMQVVPDKFCLSNIKNMVLVPDTQLVDKIQHEIFKPKPIVTFLNSATTGTQIIKIVTNESSDEESLEIMSGDSQKE